MAIIAMYGYLHKDRQPDWVIGFSYFTGVMAIIYIAFLIIGQVLWVAPPRFLGFFIPLLLGVSGYVLVKQIHITGRGAKVGVGILITLFIVTQIAPIPSHVLYSDSSEARIGDGHYSDHTLATADWADRNKIDEVITWESRLFTFRNQISVVGEPSLDCPSKHLVWQSEGREILSESAVGGASKHRVYDNGGGIIFRC
jgi:hypothetical protein